MLTFLFTVGGIAAYLLVCCVVVAFLFRTSEHWREEDWAAWVVGLGWPFGLPLVLGIYAVVFLGERVIGPSVVFIGRRMDQVTEWMATPRAKKPKLPKMEARK